ncbi:hypothetical protein FRC10_002930 [Ceratobasidium sp. 414]|nr:hypothetical protein FRC10_002930 [Ceratobasidium sp. 414]
MSETYTVTMRGEFAESKARAVTLSRDPDLFKIVLDYLSGYKVLPLHESAVTKRMGNDAAVFNLLVDAQFYQLDGLISQVEAHKPETVPALPHHLLPHVIISLACQENLSKNDVELIDMFQVQETNKGSVWSPPVPISADTAQGMKAQKGFNNSVIQNWDPIKSGLDKSLQTAQLPASYLLIASWGEKHNGYKTEFYYVLELVI